MSTKKMPVGWLKISEPDDLERAITRMLNKILASEDPVSHAGRFAALANSWVNARRLRLDVKEVRELQAMVEALREGRK